MRSDGSDERRLTTEHAYDYEPSWSPDGTRIVFHSTRDLDRTSIWSMAADGSDVRPILTGDSGDGWPSYSRDGSRLLVMRGTYSAPEWCFTPSAHIVSLAPDGSDPRPLTEPGSGAGRPDVSPDGARVVINSGRNVASCPQDPEALFTFALDGSDQRTLFSPATRGSELIQPVWSPDGQSIVATTPPAIRGGIFVLPAAGGTPVEITPGLPAGLPGWDQTYQASWQPCIAGVTRSCRSEPPARNPTGTGAPGTGLGTATPPRSTPDNAGPLLRLPATNRAVVATRAGLVRLRVGPFAEAVTGTVTLRTAKAVRLRPSAKRRIAVLGTRSFSAGVGGTADVRITLSSRARALLRRTGQLPVRATFTARDAVGNRTARGQAIRLRFARR